jgi:hypothetical protein
MQRYSWTWLRTIWRARVEPPVLTALLLTGLSLPPLLMLEVLTARQAARVAVAMGWAAIALLVLRLAPLLRRERWRLAALALIVAGALAGAWFLYTPAAQAQGGLSFKSAPRISQGAFSQILAAAGSPAAPHADELYSIIVAYGLDPAVALAFFQHESQYCTTGACARGDLRNWGMQRRAIRAERSSGVVQGFARYHTWQDGVRDWCELILGYINRGMDTVEKAVPVYAPQSDGNVPAAYIGAIRRQVTAWAGRAVGEPALRSYAGSLDQALIAETFLAAKVEFHPTWAFHNFALAEAHAGRPLGAPLDESRIISVGGQRFAVQVFALETLYTPIAANDAETNWGDVRRMSTLLRQGPAPTPAATSTPGGQ